MSAPDDTPDSARWRELQSLFDQALDLPAPARLGFVARNCGADSTLRDELTQLLRACDDAGGFLDEPVANVAGPLIARELETLGAVPAGTRIGPYRVIREIGRGGMGVVCLAERDDGEYQKLVALKVVLRRPGMEEWSVQRFRAERQILASLEHPGIARMLDGGVWEGAPWFAMEYADGLPIDEYCVTHSLARAAVLEIFAAVCDVVQYAHDRAIIHRDLKPSNILVVDGAVKLLDFGIASLTPDSDRTGHAPAADPAQLAVRSLTPGYASPEQVRGEPATGASDVYSLGVLLERLLARGASELPNVPAELRAIVRTALSPRPEDRYPGAGALAAAIRTTLGTAVRPGAHRPESVRSARPRKAWYLAGAAAILAIAITGVLVSQQREDAELGVPMAIAILPFESAALDTGMRRLGRDVAMTLSADLDGVGRIHTIDPLSIVSSRSGVVSHSTLAADASLARSLGATGFLRGGITPTGENVRLDAALYALDQSAPLLRVSTTVRARDVAAATDSLRGALLRGLWDQRAMPASSLAALSTRSPAALRAYLDGERLIVDYRMPDAAAAFSRAIEADSTFWFAYWRLAWAREFIGRRVDSNITGAYRAHRNEFAEPDRLLIEARMAPRLVDRITLTRNVAMRFQSYWPAWLDYAELLVHDGPYAGHPLAEARAPLERALKLNHRLVPAWDHLMLIALTELDTAASARVLAQLQRLNYDSAAIADGRPRILVLYRFLHGLAKSGVADSALTDSLADMLVAGSTPEEGRFQGGLSRYGFHDARIALGRRVLGNTSIAKPAAAFELGEQATTWASRGAWDSALVAADRATRLTPDANRVLFAYRIAVIGAFLGAVDTSVARGRRAGAAGMLNRLTGPGLAELAWLDGLLAVTGRDRLGVARARDALRRVADPNVSLLDSSLMAFELDLEGKRRSATATMTALELNRHEPTGRQHPYFAGIDRLVLSRWLRDAGQTEEAASVLIWTEAVVAADGQTAHANALLGGLAYFERARLEHLEGEPALARTYNEQFLRRFDMPSRREQHLVAEAREAIAERERP